jgi:hypothetical protein
LSSVFTKEKYRFLSGCSVVWQRLAHGQWQEQLGNRRMDRCIWKQASTLLVVGTKTWYCE